MSVVTYNGVSMDLVKTNKIDMRPVMSSDKTQFLCMEWSHDFEALLHPQNISYDENGRASVGKMPSVTVQGIRHKLMQPRQQYTWEIGGTTVISSPANGATTDMRNGPTTDDVVVMPVHGIRAWRIHMRITTYLNECAEMPVILSHRWRPMLDVDEHYYSTRTIVGEAEFNIPRLLQLNHGPDNYRINLGHPVPTGFQRGGIRVAISEDGATVHYQFTDVERPMDIGTVPRIADIDVDVTTGISQGTTADVGKAFVGGAVSGVQGASSMTWGQGAVSNVFRNPITSAASGVIQGLINASRQLAQVFVRCTATVVGQRNATIRELVRISSSIAANRCGALNFFGPSLTGMVCQIHWTKKIVVWTQTHSISGSDWISNTGLESVVNTLESTIQRTQDFANIRANPNTNQSGGNVVVDKFKQRIARLPNEIIYSDGNIGLPNSGNPSPLSGGTSGTWLEKLVVQSLKEPCISPTLAMTRTLYRTKSDRNETN